MGKSVDLRRIERLLKTAREHGAGGLSRLALSGDGGIELEFEAPAPVAAIEQARQGILRTRAPRDPKSVDEYLRQRFGRGAQDN